MHLKFRASPQPTHVIKTLLQEHQAGLCTGTKLNHRKLETERRITCPDVCMSPFKAHYCMQSAIPFVSFHFRVSWITIIEISSSNNRFDCRYYYDFLSTILHGFVLNIMKNRCDYFWFPFPTIHGSYCSVFITHPIFSPCMYIRLQ